MCYSYDVISDNFLKSSIKQVGAEENLLVKDHTHTFVNKGGQIGGTL